jgi:branched-chain amino acid transport system permease protein
MATRWGPALATICGFAVLYLLGAAWVQNQYYQSILTLVPIWAVMGLAWNVFSGYSGLVSFGHAAFFGLGAYTVSLLMVTWGLTPWLGMPVGMLVGMAAGAVIGWPTFRLRGHYFALAMLAYPLALLYVFEWLGYQEVVLPMQRDAPALYMQFSDQRSYVALALALLVSALLVCLKLARSRFGLALTAIKQNERAAEAAGVDTWRWKMQAIMVSGALAAAAGGLYAVVLLVVTPQAVFGMLTSAQALIVTLFGGVATVGGPVIGAVLLIPLAEVLHANLGDKILGIQGVVFGCAIVLVILLAPEGLWPMLRDKLGRGGRQTSGRAGVERIAGHGLDLPRARAASAHVILDIAELSCAFGGLQAVQAVSLHVRQGEVLGIIGPNGAGKTTLFNLINGFTLPDRGRIVFEGRDVIGLKPHQICRLGIGRTFQVVRAFPRLTVLQNVTVGAFGVEADDQAAFAGGRVALTRVGLAPLADVLASGLTHLELRLMELARALASRPQLLLLDEPLAGLGHQEVEAMLTVIGGLAATGITIVMIEHTMRAMVRLVDRFVVLDHGSVLAQGTPEDVTREPKVIEAYLGQRWMRAQH